MPSAAVIGFSGILSVMLSYSSSSIIRDFFPADCWAFFLSPPDENSVEKGREMRSHCKTVDLHTSCVTSVPHGMHDRVRVQRGGEQGKIRGKGRRGSETANPEMSFLLQDALEETWDRRSLTRPRHLPPHHRLQGRPKSGETTQCHLQQWRDASYCQLPPRWCVRSAGW